MMTEKKNDSQLLASESRLDLAEDRTEWARQRTVFARERTLSAWLRTALATVAAGLAIVKLLPYPDNPALAVGVGLLFVAAGVAIFALAFWRYREGFREMQQKGSRLIPLWWIGALTAVLILSSIVAGLFLLRMD